MRPVPVRSSWSVGRRWRRILGERLEEPGDGLGQGWQLRGHYLPHRVIV